MKIARELTPEIYKTAKDVFEKRLSREDGLQHLLDLNMNENSAADFINNFKYMLTGRKYARTNNANITEYFIANIYQDYGLPGLRNALTALALHTEYYEEIRQVKMHAIRSIYNKYIVYLNENPDEQEQDEIIRTLIQQKKSRDFVSNELRKIKPVAPEVIISNNKSYKRDNYTVALIKFNRDFKCQICSKKIKKKDGAFYVEAAHITPKFQKGTETPDNMIVLCPNHHKEFDLGDREILHRDINEVRFILNGQEYTISLRIV